MKKLFEKYRKLDPETRALVPHVVKVVIYLHAHIVHLHGWHFVWSWIAG